jgi:hypothetical protein
MSNYKSPDDYSDRDLNFKTIFLAGSIEMGKAKEWQKECELRLAGRYNILNPRRDNWTEEEKIVKEQIQWELQALEESDHIIMFFDKNTKSCVSMLEFGLYARQNKLMVVCEEDFWRKCNIDTVCEVYGIPVFKDLWDLLLEFD